MPISIRALFAGILLTASVAVSGSEAADGSMRPASLQDRRPDWSSQEPTYAIRILEVLPYATSEEARANAAGIIEVVVDHHAVPRQITGGFCPVQGRVVGVIRGAGLTPRGRIDLLVPCVGRPRPGDPRRIPEGAFATGSRSLIYLSDQQELLDAERVED